MKEFVDPNDHPEMEMQEPAFWHLECEVSVTCAILAALATDVAQYVVDLRSKYGVTS